MEEIFNIINGSIYEDEIPQEAIDLAIKENCLIIRSYSDDLIHIYGANCYLTKTIELDFYNNTDFSKYEDDKDVQKEASQLGLKVSEKGSFVFTVNDNIEHLSFTIYEDNSKTDIYCIGLIIKLPDSFKAYL